MTLEELSPFDLRRERVGRMLERKLFTAQDAAEENREIERDERAARRADRAQRRAAR